MPGNFITNIADLPSGLPNSGTIKYGPFTFTVAGKYDLDAEFVYDEADRVVTHVRYFLRCTGCIMSAQGSAGLLSDLTLSVPVQQSQMSALQDALSTPGLPLVIEDIGFDTDIATSAFNAVTTTPDLIWGAKPRGARFRPHGLMTWEFDWECEFNISRCMYSGVGPGSAAPMAWNYDMTFSVNEEGLQQRTISGYLQCAAIRNPDPVAIGPGNDVLFDIEAAWDQFTVNVPYGFRRTNSLRSVNKAKNRIDFAIIDSELTSDAYPAGIVEADIDYEIGSRPPGLAGFNCSLAGELTVAPGYPKALALSKYLAILNAKITELRQISADSGQKVRPIPVSILLRHKLFTRTTYFAVSFFLASDVNTLLQESGMWNVIPGTDYQQWAQSMIDAKVWDSRGVAGLKFDRKEDKFVTICLSPGAIQLPNKDSLHPFDNTGQTTTPTTPVNKQPDEAGDYLFYRNQVEPVKSANFTIHRFATQTGTSDSPSNTDHVVQYQSAPDNFIVMRGTAARLDSKPVMPTLTSVGGQSVELLTQSPDTDDLPITLAFGHKVYRASWELVYRIKGTPTAGTGEIPAVNISPTEPVLGQI